jgi:glyoxylase-like metal-dependent hydrolase (beta-lactamase superfamily II)
MIFEQIVLSKMDNFSYVIGDEDTKEAAVVDPAWENDKILDVAKKHGLKVTKIIVTHTDYDHIEGVGDMAKDTGATIIVHKKGEHTIRQLGIDNVETVDEGSEFNIGNVKVKVMYTPGHNPTQCCFLMENKVITGDTLFVEGCGRVDFPHSNIKDQWESLQRLKALDENIEVYPGHDYGSMPSSTIKHEKENNHFLKCNSFEEFTAIR